MAPLAGADLEMPRALEVMVDEVGDNIARAIQRATSTPTELLREHSNLGILSGSFKTATYLEKTSFNPIVLNGAAHI